MATWEGLCNEALRQLGVKKRIGSAYEGSEVAKACLELFSQVRDELLQREEWPFAMREAGLTAVAGQLAPAPWPYEFNYPSDCLRIRYVQPGSFAALDPYDPQPVLFEPWNDQRPSPPIRAILASISPATLVYVGQVTNPNTWEPGFTRAFVASLAAHLTLSQAATNLLQQEAGISEASRDTAAVVDDTAAPPRMEMIGAGGGTQR
jgi:hypothetical protein